MSDTSAKVIRLSWRQAPAALAYGAPIVLLILYLYVGNYFPQLYGAVLSWWHVILAGIGGLAAWAGFSGRLASLGRVGGTLMATGLVLAVLASLTAMDTARSVVNTWLLAGYLALFWITVTAARLWGRRWLSWTLAIGAMALALAGLVIDATGTTYAGFDVRSVPAFTFPLGNKNFTASFFLLVWPFFIGAAQAEDEPLPRWTLIGGALLALYCLLGSDSRAAYLAAVVQLGLLAVMLAGPMKQALGQIPRKAWAAIAAGTLVVGAVVLVVTPVGERVNSVVRTVTEITDGGYVSDNSAAMRLEMWRGALAGYGERIVQGHGLGSVPTHFPANRMQSPRYPDVVNPQLHSTPFHVLYELGLTGVLLLAAIAAYLLWALGRVLRQERPAPEAIGIGIGLLGYGFSLLTDFHWEVPSLTVSFVLAAALLIAAIRGDEESPAMAVKPAAMAGGLLGITVLGGSLYMLATKDRAALAYDRGYTALATNQYQAGIDAWREAIALDPSTPFYNVALGSTIHYLTSDQPNGAAEVQALREEALTLLIGATDSVHLALAKIKTGQLLVKLDRPQEAIPHLVDAARLTYYAPVPHFFLGEAYRALGEQDKAIQAYGTALAFSPALQWASLWQSPEGAALREPVAEYALGLYQRQGTPDEWLSRHMGQLYVMLGRRAQAEGMLEPLLAADNPNRETARLWYGEAAFRARDWAAAVSRFAAVLEAQPANGFAKLRLAQAKYQLGDASMVDEGLAALMAHYAQATDAMIHDPAAMAQAAIPIGFDTRKGWANMAYRRAAPDQPFPNPIPLQPGGMYFLSDEKPWPGFPRVTYRQLTAAAGGDVAPALAELPVP